MDATVSLSPLATRIEAALNDDLERPWCVHRLYEEFVSTPGATSREDLLAVTQRAAEELVRVGHARQEYVSATTIGVHCEDTLYWSSRSTRQRLADFGPAYEWPTVVQRLGSHFQCRGL
ncbi:MAG: hypothetical protein WB786_03435 [Thermoplasmata archaeon]